MQILISAEYIHVDLRFLSSQHVQCMYKDSAFCVDPWKNNLSAVNFVSVLTLLENHSRYLFSSAMYLDFNRNDHMT